VQLFKLYLSNHQQHTQSTTIALPLLQWHISHNHACVHKQRRTAQSNNT